MTLLKRYLYLAFLILMISGLRVTYAQGVQSDTLSVPLKTFSRITKDEQSGMISKGTAILDKFYAIFNPTKLGSRYQIAKTQNRQKITYKCLTPLIADYEQQKSQLKASARNTINGYIYPKISGTVYKYISPSKKFVIYYTTSGRDSVSVKDGNNDGTPDYVEWAASYADSSYNDEVRDIGFTNPIVYGRPYPIYIADLTDYYGNAIYGYTTTDSLGGTKMYINSKFGSNEFPNNWDPDGKLKGELKVTIAHEFKHAIQYRVDGWSDQFETSKWLEMDATMMEDVVFDPVDDYINYLSDPHSIFSNPQFTMYPGSYQQVTWALYFVRNYGIQFWKRVWDDIVFNHYITMKSAVSDVLKRYYNKSFNKQFVRDYLWHYASGKRSYPGYGFAQKKRYPTAKLATDDSNFTSGFLPDYYQSKFSGEFQKIIPDKSDQGNVYVTLFDNNQDGGIGLLALKNDSTTSEVIEDSTNSEGMLNIKTPWYWSNLKSLGVVTTDNSTKTSVNTRVLIGANSVLYGDVNDSGTLNDNDVDDIFNYVLGIKTTLPYERFFGDVSGNGKLTPYDAALVLKHLDGLLPHFSIDSNKDNRGPELSSFKTPTQLKTVAGSYQQKGSSATKVINQSGMSISLDSTAVLDNKEDARLTISLSNPDNKYYSSLYIKISFPKSLIKNVEVDTSHSVWKNSLYKSSYESGVFQLAIAEPDSFKSGILAHLNLTAGNEGLAQFNIDKAELNENPDSIVYNNLSMNVKPRTAVAIKKNPQIPHKITLSQNYPNPFNPTTVIPFTLPSSSKIKLDVYNINGQKVETLASGTYAEGQHMVQFNGDNLASGVYFYRLFVKTANKTVVKRRKMILLK